MSSKNNGRHLAVAPLSKIYSYGGKKQYVETIFQKENMSVVVLSLQNTLRVFQG